MSRTSKITPEVELEIVEKYRAGENSQTIRDAYHLDGDRMYNILAKHGIEPRRPRRKKRHCDCGAVMPSEAKFCYMCGKNLKTDEEIIIDNLLSARTTCLKYVPDAQRTVADKQIMAAVNLLKEKCGVK